MMHHLLTPEMGLAIIRIGIGIMFIIHGYPKLMGGVGTWTWLGNQMSHLGITFAPVVWGFLAAATEFFGGICLTVGFATRIASFFLACVMFVAVVMHVSQGDVYREYSHALSLLVVFIGLIVAGGGYYTIGRMFGG